MLRAAIYACCFALVAIPTLYGYGVWALSLANVATPYSTLLSLTVLSYGSLVPSMFVPLVPRSLLMGVGCLLLFLLLRRVWLFFSKKDRVPGSFKGLPKVLGYVGISFYVIAWVGMGLSMLLRAGSGVPAGMLMIPAMFCIPWAFFLTEVLSFFQPKAQNLAAVTERNEVA